MGQTTDLSLDSWTHTATCCVWHGMSKHNLHRVPSCMVVLMSAHDAYAIVPVCALCHTCCCAGGTMLQTSAILR